MNIPIPKELTPERKYTKEAQAEIKSQVVKYVGRICEEAERMEASSTEDFTQIQITPRAIQRAVRFVLDYPVEGKSAPKFIEYVCPGVQGLLAIALAVLSCIESLCAKDVIAGIIALIYIIFLVIQITYKCK